MRRLTWHNASQSDHQLREYLILALLRSHACVTLQDERLTYLYIANLPSIWTVSPEETPDDLSVFGELLGSRLIAAKKDALETSDPVRLESDADGGRVFQLHVETVQMPDQSRQVLTTIIDITENRRREQVLKDLLKEVSHRSRNLLAVIQGLATQSARYASSTEDFLTQFRGRIFSLASAQDLVTEADWYGVPVRDLAEAQAGLLPSDARPQILFSGDNATLSPNAALYIGLGFHELLLRTAGDRIVSGRKRILLTCKPARSRGRDDLEITWKVEGERLAKAGGVSGDGRPAEFSSLLLEQIVPQSLSGSAEFAPACSGEGYRLVFPASEYNVRQKAFESLD
ncbi:MAG: sensor histidine kinase [Roseibium sp.]